MVAADPTSRRRCWGEELEAAVVADEGTDNSKGGGGRGADRSE